MNQESTYRCNHCDYSTKDQSNFNRHNRSRRHFYTINKNKMALSIPKRKVGRPKRDHTGSNILWNCPDCNTNFKHKCSLKRHLELRCPYVLSSDNNLHNKTNIDTQQITNIDTQQITNNDLSNSTNTLNRTNIQTQNNIETQNNIQNNTLIDNSTRITINYLNKYFPDMIPISEFIDGMKNDYQLTETDAKRLLSSKKSGRQSFQEEFTTILGEKCKKQIDDKGLHFSFQNKIPILTTDCSVRTHNEKTKLGWIKTASVDNLKEIYHLYNDQVYAHTNQYIALKEREQIYLYNFIRRAHLLTSVFDEDKFNEIEEKRKEKFLKDQLIEKKRRDEIIKRKQKEFIELHGYELTPLDLSKVKIPEHSPAKIYF